MKKLSVILAGLISFLFSASPVSAHAFGKLYNLPVPFWLYLYGGAAAIIVSFLIIGYFVNQTKKSLIFPNRDISSLVFVAVLKNSLSKIVLKSLVLFLFVLAVLTGIFGVNTSYANFNMTFFWIIFVLGTTYLCAIVGNVWNLVNPWKTLAELFEFMSSRPLRGYIDYPQKFAYYQELLFYFIFILIELTVKATPFDLSFFIIDYTALTFGAVFLFGKENWFAKGEFFSVLFGLISKVAPLEYSAKKVYLRAPFVGLLKDSAQDFSQLLFILFMLSSTAFDGFRSTLPWRNIYTAVFKSQMSSWGDSLDKIVQTASLLISPLLFLAIYLILLVVMKILVRSNLSLKDLALKFAFSLIPIALVYNVAHYYTLLLIQGQDIIRLASDPFGFGWNLFKTANFSPNIRLIDANFVWHSQVALILIGHIAAVYLAHLVAINLFPSHKKALASQFPMLALMVIYTMIGLWILSQPITTGG